MCGWKVRQVGLKGSLWERCAKLALGLLALLFVGSSLAAGPEHILASKGGATNEDWIAVDDVCGWKVRQVGLKGSLWERCAKLALGLLALLFVGVKADAQPAPDYAAPSTKEEALDRLERTAGPHARQMLE